MKLEQISKWITSDIMSTQVDDAVIKSWLLETGPITKRIQLDEKFNLIVLKDEVDHYSSEEKDFLGVVESEIRIREEILMGNNKPKVFARSLIPVITINEGFSKLGELGNKPLGDILFEKDFFTKKQAVYCRFKDNDSLYWARKTKYEVNKLPLSVMEVFLINVQ